MTPADAIAFMIKHKVTHFRDGDLEITLHPDALAAEAPQGAVEVKGPDLDARGTTGMSRREQMELLGTVYEADFQGKT